MKKLLSFLVLGVALIASSPSFAATAGGAYWDGTRDGGANGCFADSREAAIACTVADWQAQGAGAKVISDDGTTVSYCVQWGGSCDGINTANYTPSSQYQIRYVASGYSGTSFTGNRTVSGTTFSDSVLTAAYSGYTGSGGGGGTCEFGGTYPACDPAPTCEFGGTYPSCNPPPSCEFGGTYPNCDLAPTCEFGGTYPDCAADPNAGGGDNGGGSGALSSFEDLVSAVDFSSSVLAIMAIFAALALVYVAWRGGRFVLASLKGGRVATATASKGKK